MRVLTKICLPSRASVLAKISIPPLRYRVGSGESLDEDLSSITGECLGEDLYSDTQIFRVGSGESLDEDLHSVTQI